MSNLPSATSSKEIVTSQDGAIGNGAVQVGGNDEKRCIEQGTIGGGVQHGSVEENESVDFLLPLRPIEGVVRVFRGLRCKNDVCIFASTMFQSCGDIGVCGFIVQQNRTGNVGQFIV
jgi:hypothetical protein